VADEADGRRKPVMIRFDRELLARVDKAAKHRGVNRSAWISYVISQALETD
jgi:metal-responsive CopG/Arc/MetJ family transcriptional regulator